MSLADPQLADYLASLPPDAGGAMDIAAARARGDRAAAAAPSEPELVLVRDLDAGGCPARLYRPSLSDTPLLLYLHGGGWTLGSVAAYDRTTRRLARRSGVAVLSLGYRLAPEHPWPASVQDAIAALTWIAGRPAELDGLGPVGVAGDSAGGSLAALACLALRDAGSPAQPALQALMYPNTDLAGEWPSLRENAVGYGLTAADVRFFAEQWVPDRERWTDPHVSPLRASDLARLPPALLVLAGYDPLRDEGVAYAEALARAGVPVRHRCEAGLVHNFLQLEDVSPACAAASARVAQDIRELFASVAHG